MNLTEPVPSPPASTTIPARPPPSTYKAISISSSGCSPCPDHSSTGTATGSKEDTECKADAGYIGEGSEVKACSPGTYKDKSSWPSGPSLCHLCAPGKHKAAAASTTACDECAKGKFQATKGNSACEGCIKGTYSTAIGYHTYIHTYIHTLLYFGSMAMVLESRITLYFTLLYFTYFTLSQWGITIHSSVCIFG
jgi:hypothetical protein